MGLGLSFLAAQEPSLRPANLRCEHEVSPLAVEAGRPRLSWILESSDPAARGLRQTAFRVLAASSLALLSQDQGDLWDSGRVESPQSHLVAYAGALLKPRTRCFWKVRAWDESGRPSAWSAPAEWTMGLSDWAPARWIGAAPAAAAEDPLDGCPWVWSADGAPGVDAPPGKRWFRRAFDLPADARVEQAVVLMAADNGFTLFVNGKEAGSGSQWESASRIDIAPRLVPGTNALAVAVTNGGIGPNPAGLLGKLTVRLDGGKSVAVPVDSSWKAHDREEAGWKTAAFDDAAWKPARVLGAHGMPPWGKIQASSSGAMPLFRRAFAADKPVRRALVSVCGLGHYELRLNGKKVGDAALEPGWTNYRKTCLYQTYDVTPMIVRGENALGVLLGNGMYNVTGGRYIKFKGTFGAPTLILRLDVEHEDGASTTVVSDASWKSAFGPIVFSCVYGGEDYDARREAPGWDRPGFDDAAWRPAGIVDGPGGILSSRSAPPVKVMQEFKAARVTEPRPGIFVYDLGQNFSGRPRIVVEGPAGATVKMIPGELLDGNGLASQRSSGGPVWFSYTLKGEGKEEWHPRFSYYGFRYVQVEGAAPAGLPRVLELTGQFLYSSAASAGEISCSNPDIGRIHDLINAAIRSNLQSVLTDCPHREKLGWLECTHLLAGCVFHNYDVPRFFAKIARDMREAQLDNGMVPDIAPEYTVFSGGFRDSPEWGSAYVLIPWIAWQVYGDRGLLEEHYEGMKKYVAYLGSKSKEHIVSHGLGDWYDIGPRGPGESQLTSRGVTATGIYYQDIEVLRKTAELLGRIDDVRLYADLASKVRAAFNAKYFRPETNQYDRNSQTASALPLVAGLVEEGRRAAVLESLVKDIRGRGNRVTAGDVGFFYVVRALSDGGRGDVLYDMICQNEGPGYLCQLKKGATTLTEAWDTNPGSSQNHCMLGHAEEWFFRGLGGIRPDPDGPGFAKMAIRPQAVGDLAWAKARYESVRGTISTHWKKQEGSFSLDVVIPGNTTAAVHVPAKDAGAVTEGGKPVSQAKGVRFLRMEGGEAVFEVGSGKYVFVSE
jgi:hypothetical protein